MRRSVLRQPLAVVVVHKVALKAQLNECDNAHAVHFGRKADSRFRFLMEEKGSGFVWLVALVFSH